MKVVEDFFKVDFSFEINNMQGQDIKAALINSIQQ